MILVKICLKYELKPQPISIHYLLQNQLFVTNQFLSNIQVVSTETRSDPAGTLTAMIRITRTNAARPAVRTDLLLQPQQQPLPGQPPPPQSEPPPPPLPQPPHVDLPPQPAQVQREVSFVKEIQFHHDHCFRVDVHTD